MSEYEQRCVKSSPWAKYLKCRQHTTKWIHTLGMRMIIWPIWNKPEARFYSSEKIHMSVSQSVYDTESNNSSCISKGPEALPSFPPFRSLPRSPIWHFLLIDYDHSLPFLLLLIHSTPPPGHNPLDVKWLKITSGLMPSPQKTPKASDVAPHEASVAFSSILILLRPEDIYHYTHTHHVPHNSLWCELVTRPQRTNTSLTSVSIFHCLRFNSMRDGRKAAKYDREENAR